MVSTHLKNISQLGPFPPIGVNHRRESLVSFYIIELKSSEYRMEAPNISEFLRKQTAKPAHQEVYNASSCYENDVYTFYTPRKTNMAIENKPFEDVSPTKKKVIFHCHAGHPFYFVFVLKVFFKKAIFFPWMVDFVTAL